MIDMSGSFQRCLTHRCHIPYVNTDCSGHQEGCTRPPYPGDSKIYVDPGSHQGKSMMHTACGANPFQTTLNGEEHRRVILRRSQIVKDALAQARG